LKEAAHRRGADAIDGKSEDNRSNCEISIVHYKKEESFFIKKLNNVDQVGRMDPSSEKENHHNVYEYFCGGAVIKIFFNFTKISHKFQLTK
jgi:hypothetical protein